MDGSSLSPPHAPPLSISHDALLLHELRALAQACRGGSAPAPDAVTPCLARLDVLLSPSEAFSGECLLEEALKVVEGGPVTRLRGLPSGRVAWQVGSLALGARGGGGGGGRSAAAGSAAQLDLEGSGLTPSGEAGGGSGGAHVYTVLLDGPGLCTCQRFAEQLRGEGAGSGGGRLCRHLLAAHIASAALGTPSVARVRQRDTSDEDLARLLMRALCR
jgi:hypothetical protein